VKTLKSRDGLVAVFFLALSALPANADSYCGPGLKLGAENDCPGCSWLCIPDPSPQPMSSARPAPAGAAGLLQQALSQLEPTDGLSNVGADPSGNGIRSREFNRSALAAMQDRRFMHAALRFRLAAGFARDAGNAREEYLNRRNALLMQLAGKLKAGIDAEGRARTTQAQVSYREAQVLAAQIAAMPPAAVPATTAAAAPLPSAPNQAAADPASAPASTVSGLGNGAGAAPHAGKAPARQATPAPVVARTRPGPSPAAIGQIVAPLLQVARQPLRAPATVHAPAAAVQPAPVAAAPNNSTISPRQPSPVAPIAQAPVRAGPVAPAPTVRTPAAPVVAAPQPAPVAQPVVVTAPPTRPVLVQPVVVQVPAAPAPGSGIDPQPVAAVPDPDIDYSGMDPDALINAYGTQDPDYAGRNPYNPDPNAGYDPGGSVTPDPSPQHGGYDPGGSPDPAPGYSATAPVAAVRDPDIVCAGGPCTGGAGGYQGGPGAVDPGTGSLGGPGGGGAVVLPGADPDGGDDLGGVSVHVEPTSKPWAAGGDLRSKVLKLTR
jgi:hypothetical protein